MAAKPKADEPAKPKPERKPRAKSPVVSRASRQRASGRGGRGR